jgi:hypothetical protein
MNTQPTPISDRIVSQFRKGEAHSDGLILTMVDLENQLTAALAEIERLDVAGIHTCHSECQKSNCVLRRELTAVTEQRDEWKAKYIQQNKDLGCEQMDPNGTIWDYAKKVQTELTAITEQRDRLHFALKQSSTIYDVVTEQRDKLAEALQKLRNNESMSLGGAAYEIVEQALQSLTPNA